MKKILLVDDTKWILNEIKDILIMEGYQVFTATNGSVGAAKVVLYNPDLVITDITMPGMDGYGLISSIKTSIKHKAIPIIVLSGNSGAGDIRKSMLLKADAYLTKPCSADDLLDTIKALLSP